MTQAPIAFDVYYDVLQSESRVSLGLLGGYCPVDSNEGVGRQKFGRARMEVSWTRVDVRS